MASPVSSSSATSLSPSMSCLSHSDGTEHDLRKQAVQKFLARAELSMVTRALRARLAYASYKARHNLSHLPLTELEGHLSHSHPLAPNRSIAAKRRSAPATLGPAQDVSRRATHMPPPSTTTTSKRSSLYNSLLAPPTTNPARTVLNAHRPPVPPPSRPAPSPSIRAKSAAGPTRTHAKAKQSDKKSPGRKPKQASPDNKRKTKPRSRPSGGGGGQQQKQKQPHSVDADGDVDMKAAATLTSLLLNHRSSIHGGSTHSPRSSIDGSESGSVYSYSHFAQSSARSTTAASPPASSVSTIPAVTAEASPPASYRQHQTPPPPSLSSVTPTQHSTPRPSAPTDNEAADLMLFLATSPSPVRPTPRQRDPSTYRSLGNDPAALRSKGRILFPSSSAPDVMVITREDPSPRPQPTLARTSDGNYTLHDIHGGPDLHGVGVRAPPLSSAVTPRQLLPSASLPSSQSSSASSRMPESPLRKDVTQSPRTVFGSGGTPAAEFNFNEFINASPSPSRPPQGQGHKHNSSLRADVGRKLFEEEQMKHHIMTTASPGVKRSERRGGGGGGGGLNASAQVDIVHHSQ